MTTNGGGIVFRGMSTAANATITLSTPTDALNASNNGFAWFRDGSSAGNATITVNKYSFLLFDPPIGGVSPSGATARIIANEGGTVQGNAGLGDYTGVIGFGSLEGAGTFNFGLGAVTVGSNDRSTEISGPATLKTLTRLRTQSSLALRVDH